MKLFIISLLLLSSSTAICQESFKKSFKLTTPIVLKGNDTIQLKKEEEVKFSKLTGKEQDSIKRIYEAGSILTYTAERSLHFGKVMMNEKVRVNDEFYQKIKIKKAVAVDSLPIEKGFVIFVEDKVWVNPNLSGSYENHGLYYYQLKNRQSIDLRFTEATVSALTLPIKYRFKNEEKNISEEFTTAVNLNLFVGWAFYGKTKFHYREKVGNVTNTSKLTIGGLIGASTVSLDKSNTSASAKPIIDDSKLTKGLASLGAGLTYTFNKINFGVFYGYDFSIGDDSSRWNYNRKPWLGIAVGYSLLPF